jgi:hypothetical protein
MLRAIFLLSLSLILLGGCGGRAAEDMQATDDPFRPYKEIEGGVHRFAVKPGQMAIRLVAQIDRKTGATKTLFKVHHHYVGQHRFNFESARNIRAELLTFSVVARYGNCSVRKDCPLDELYTVEVPEADLRQTGASGYPFKVFPRVGGDVLVLVPTEVIKNMLALLDLDRRKGAVIAVAKPEGLAASKPK